MPAPPWLVLPHASDEQSAALGRPSALVPLRDRAGVTQGLIDGSRRTDGGHDRAGGRPALGPASDPDARPPTRWDRAGSRRSAYASRPGTSPRVQGTRRRSGGRATSGHSTRVLHVRHVCRSWPALEEPPQRLVGEHLVDRPQDREQAGRATQPLIRRACAVRRGWANCHPAHSPGVEGRPRPLSDPTSRSLHT